MKLTSGKSKFLASILLLTQLLSAQPSTKPVDWHAFQFLLGEWVGEGSGDPGWREGGFTFLLDFQNRKSGTESMKITFGIAPPGKPESFAPYIEAVAHRKK